MTDPKTPKENPMTQNDEAERLIEQIASAVEAVRPAGILSSNAKLSAALFALYNATALIRTQAARIAELEEALSEIMEAESYIKRESFSGNSGHVRITHYTETGEIARAAIQPKEGK
jgi:hypothetical protein